MMERSLRGTLLKAIVPALIGLGVVTWLFIDDFQASDWRSIPFDCRTVTAICVAVLFVIGRDLGLTWRFHAITDGALSWARALRVDIMCAFTSAITPSVVGGSALAIFYLNREGLSVGRATTLTLTTLLLDELFFVVFCPVIFLLIPRTALFGSPDMPLLHGVEWIFWLVYAGIVIWTAILFTGIIARPEWLERTVSRLFSTRFLRRWKEASTQMTGNMRATSAWVKTRGMGWW